MVDDDVDFNDLVVSLVMQMGHTVEGQAFDGESAVRMITGNPGNIDVVIMDVVMPVENGIFAAEKILRISPVTKILLMSGDWTNKCLVPDMENIHFIQKPFGIEDLRMEMDYCAAARETAEDEL